MLGKSLYNLLKTAMRLFLKKYINIKLNQFLKLKPIYFNAGWLAG